MAAVLIIFDPWGTDTGSVDLITSVGITGLLIVIYTISRTSHYKLSAALAIGGFSVAALTSAAADNVPGSTFFFTYLVVPVLLSSLLFSIRTTILVFAANTIAMLLAAQIRGISITDLPIVFILIVSVLILVATRYRNLLEHDRRAALEQAHDELEQRVAERTAELANTVEKLEHEAAERLRAEAALRQAELHYRTVADATYDWVYWLDAGGSLVYVSPSCERITGYPAEQLIQSPQLMDELVISEDKHIWTQHRHETQTDHKLRELQFRIRRQDGEIRWMEHVCRPVINEHNQFMGYRASNRDISERKHMEHLLHVQHSLAIALSTTMSLTEALDHILDASFEVEGIDCGGIYLVDEATGSLVLATHRQLSDDCAPVSVQHTPDSPQARLILAGEPVYTRAGNSAPGTDPQQARCSRAIIPVKYEGQVVAALNLDSHGNTEIPHHVRSSLEAIAAQVGGMLARVWAEEALRRHRDNLEGLVVERTVDLVYANESLNQEIAERQQVEAALEKERNLLRTVIDNLPDFIYVKDTEGRFVLANTAVALFMGTGTPDGLVGKTDFDFYPEQKAMAFYNDEQYIVRTGKTIVNKLETAFFSGGDGLWLLTTKVPLRDDQGQLLGIVGIGKDITDRRRIEEALRQRATQLAIINKISRQITRMMDIDALLERAVHLVQEDLDYQHAALFILNPETRTLMMRAKAGIYAHRFPLGHRLEVGKGLVGWAAQHNQTVLANDVHADERYYNPFPEDIIQAELSIPIRIGDHSVGVFDVQSQEINAFDENDILALETLSDQIAIAIQNLQWYEELERHTISLEGAVQERTRELNRSHERLTMILNSSSDTILLANSDGRISQANPMFCELFQYHDDEYFQLALEALVRADYADALRSAQHATLAQGTVQHLEVVAQRKDDSVFHASIGLSPITGLGEESGVVCIIHDITERIQAEQALREALAKERELSELKSNFVSMVSHEFRTPLATIKASASNLHRYSDRMDQEGRNRRFNRISDQIDHMTNLLEDVLMIGRIEGGHVEFTPVTFDIEEFVAKIIEEFQVTGLPQRLDFTRNVRRASSDIQADKKLMRQVITNLISNAVKYSPEESTISVNLDHDGDHVTLQFIDEGIGIPKDEQAGLFQTFHRASNVGARQGTGLGLAIAKRAVELHHGTISVESDAGQGARFVVTIPCTSPSQRGNPP